MIVERKMCASRIRKDICHLFIYIYKNKTRESETKNEANKTTAKKNGKNINTSTP